MYVLAPDGAVVKYPYSITDLVLDNPHISWPAQISDELAAEYGCQKVDEIETQVYDQATQICREEDPLFVDGRWVRQWSIIDKTPEQISAELSQRAAAITLTPRQGRIMLAKAGLLAPCEAFFATATGDDAEIARIEWEYATSWERGWPALNTAAHALGLSDHQIDQMFIDASCL